MTEALAARGRLLGWLPDFLFRADRGVLGYVAKAWLLALLPSLALSALVSALAPDQPGPGIAGDTPWLFVLLIIVAPLLESLIMGGVLLLLHRWLGAERAAVASAGLWAIAHSVAAPVWGLVVWWPFLILSIVFLTWRHKGFLFATGMATAVHGLQNSVPALVLLATANG